ncbi:MAG: ComF family protein, partial [Lachnospiraceae bacterium]|nr:ComF family protein [Lachnospiraceae bacterium]
VSPRVLIPVPLHPSKQRARGYNQAQLLAAGLSECISVPMADNLIYRVKKTTPQKELSDNYRKKNMKKAFKMAENIVKLDVVMVIDDIYTTGSTMDAISECLLEAGVKEIYCLSLCIGNGF